MSASPSDRAHLAPVDIGESGWNRFIRSIFRNKHTDTLDEVRAEGTGLDQSTALSKGRFESASDLQQRGVIPTKLIQQGRRSQMHDIPTAQALIRQVTGIGDPPQGR